MEDARYDIRSILRLLVVDELGGDLGPLWIAGHGDEQVRLPKFPDQRHAVLETLLHVAR